MRNILILPLIILLTSCETGNIRVTNNIGEKYIVPRKTIKIKEWRNYDAILALDNLKPIRYRTQTIERNQALINKIKIENGYNASKVFTDQRFKYEWLGRPNRGNPWASIGGYKLIENSNKLSKEKSQLEFQKFKKFQNMQGLVSINDKRYNTDFLHSKIITYRPIYIDLNNKKFPKETMTVSCINYNFISKVEWGKTDTGGKPWTYLEYLEALFTSNPRISNFAPSYNLYDEPSLASKKQPASDEDLIKYKICKKFGMY